MQEHPKEPRVEKCNVKLKQGEIYIPPPLDFGKLQKEFGKDTPEYKQKITDYALEVKDAFEVICDLENPNMKHEKTFTVEGNKVVAESARVVGSPESDLLGIRHVGTFNQNAKVVMDVVSRLYYSDLNDDGALEIKLVEDCDCEEFNWLHCSYAISQFSRMLVVRDFLGIGFCHEESMMMGTRTCEHPDMPPLPIPGYGSLLAGIFRKPSGNSAYRATLAYIMKIIPDGDNKCKMVMFQYSSLGGVVTANIFNKEVVSFGAMIFKRFYDMMGQIVAKQLAIGPDTKDYLVDPLKPTWKWPVGECIPGLKKNF